MGFAHTLVRVSSANNNSVQAEWLRQSRRVQSQPSETPRWRITPQPASVPCVTLNIALRSQFQHSFSLCRCPIFNEHTDVVANCDYSSEWVIGYAHALGLQCDGWRRENHSSRSFYLRATCYSLFTNYTNHSKSPDLCGYWQSIARSVSLQSYY